MLLHCEGLQREVLENTLARCGEEDDDTLEAINNWLVRLLV
jgi:hypothetical protein